MKYRLTEKGKKKFQKFIESCQEQREKILKQNLDTADDTNLPDEESVLMDIEWFVDEDGDYCNNWGVTDSHESEEPLCLKENIDFVKED